MVPSQDQRARNLDADDRQADRNHAAQGCPGSESLRGRRRRLCFVFGGAGRQATRLRADRERGSYGPGSGSGAPRCSHPDCGVNMTPADPPKPDRVAIALRVFVYLFLAVAGMSIFPVVLYWAAPVPFVV